MKRQNLFRRLDEIDIRHLDWKAAAYWPLAARLLLCGLLFTAMLGSGHVLHLRGLDERNRQAAVEEQRQKDALRDKAGRLALTASYRRQIDKLESRLTNYEAALYPGNDPSLLLQDISGVAADKGLKVIQVVWLDAQATEGIQRLQLDLEGGYHAMGAFVGELGALPRLLVPATFDIRRVEGNLQATLTVTAHFRVRRRSG